MASKLSPVQEKELLLWLKAQGRQFSSPLSVLLLMSLGVFVLRVGAMWALSVLLHQMIIEGHAPDQFWLITLALLFIGQSVLIFLKGSCSAKTEQQLTHHYQKKIDQELQLHHLALIRQQPVAYWQTHFMKRSPALSRYYLDFQQQQKLASIAPLLVLAIVLPLNWLIALILIVAAPLIPVFMWLTGMGAANAHRENFVAIDRLNHLFLDRLKGRRLLQLFQREKAEQEKFEVAGTELKERALKVLRLAFLSASVLDFFSTVAMALVAVLVGFSLLGEVQLGHWREQLNFQQGLFLLLMTPLFFAELKLLGRFYHTKSEAIGAAAELRPLLEPIKPHSSYQAVDITSEPLKWPEVQLLGMDATPLLALHSLTLKRGDRLFLQGPSGSGKSVLLEALLGLRDHNRNGEKLSSFSRSDVAWMGQSATILPGTVRENLTLGESFTEEQLIKVLAQVELSDWLAQQPKGLAQIMGEQPPLSGGQAQRLALARTLLFDKPVVLLDEPTAHLTEQQHTELARLLQNHLADKTVVWVSHRELPQAWFNQQWQVNSNPLPAQLICQQESSDEA